MLRAFIAAEISPEIQGRLGKIIGFLRPQIPGVTWARAENIHLTLKFLGNIEEGNISEINRIISTTAAAGHPFAVEVGGLGCFPHIRRPSVIWIGVREKDEILQRLAGEVEKHLSALGFQAEERPFHPHLTLGRVKKSIGKLSLTDLFSAARAENLGVTRITTVTLFKSTLTPQGSVYEIILKHPLALCAN